MKYENLAEAAAIEKEIQQLGEVRADVKAAKRVYVSVRMVDVAGKSQNLPPHDMPLSPGEITGILCDLINARIQKLISLGVVYGGSDET